MNIAYDYESLGCIQLNPDCPLLEAYRGTDIVEWYGRIERSLISLLNDAEKGKNYAYADKVRQFLKTWRDYPIDGSLNRETLEALKAASEQLAVDTWNLNSYFSSLRDSLRKLIASEEELPRGIDMTQNEPAMSAMGGGTPPMTPAFGPEKEAAGLGGGTPPEGAPGEAGVPPGGPEGEAGAGGPGAPGAPGAPGEEGAVPPEEEERPTNI